MIRISTPCINYADFMPHRQTRAYRLVRALAHRKRARRLVRRDAPGSDVPTRHEPRAARPPALAPQRMHWMDRRVRAGRVGARAVPDGPARVEGRPQGAAAIVSVSIASPIGPGF